MQLCRNKTQLIVYHASTYLTTFDLLTCLLFMNLCLQLISAGLLPTAEEVTVEGFVWIGFDGTGVSWWLCSGSLGGFTGFWTGFAVSFNGRGVVAGAVGLHFAFLGQSQICFSWELYQFNLVWYLFVIVTYLNFVLRTYLIPMKSSATSEVLKFAKQTMSVTCAVRG